jgi:hypothetical protein
MLMSKPAPAPDEARWKLGWARRAGASDILEPDCERECCVYWAAPDA